MGECSSRVETGQADNPATGHSGGNGRLAVVSVWGSAGRDTEDVFCPGLRQLGLL